MTLPTSTADLQSGSATTDRSTLRRLAMLGTALGSSLCALTPTVAQNVTSLNGTGPYTLTETGTRSGGPRTIDVSTSAGDITIDVGTIVVDNTTNTTGAGIAASQTGTGNVSIKDANVTATGTGPTNAIDARANNGNVVIENTGVITSTGNANSRGIAAAITTAGNITVTSNEANGSLRGISTSGASALTTITSGTATASGLNSINAILAQGNRVVLNSGTASNTNAAGNSGTAIFVNTGAGGALVNAGTTTALGQNQAALQVFSQGVVDVTSGTVRTTQSSSGISIASGTDIIVRSTIATTEGGTGAYGIVLGANQGGGGFNSNANGINYTSANVTSGTITTVGANSHGIYATPNGTGTTTITSGAITTSGANANGILVGAIGTGVIGGATTINSTGALQTSGTGASVIRYNGGTGSLAINNSGTITSGGNNALGIVVFNANGATVTSNSITTTGTGVSTGMQIGASTTASNPISITSGTINVQNAASSGSGIIVTPPDAAATTIVSGTINVAGTGGGIGVQNRAGATGDVSITSGNITLSAPASAAFRAGISTFQTGGTTTISSTGTIQSGGLGIFLQGRANQPAGAVNVTSNAIIASGNAIDVGFGNGVTINSTGAIRATGVNTLSNTDAIGIRVAGSTGALIVNNAGSITATGSGIVLLPTSGDSNVTSNAISVSGANASGILIASNTGTPQPGNATVLNTGALTTAGNNSIGINVQTAAGTATITNNGTIAANGANSFGISVIPGSGAVNIGGTGTITSTGAGILVGANQRYAAPVTIATGGVTTSGAGASAIQVTNSDGAVSVTSGPIVTTGANTNAILISAVGGSIAVNASDVRANGANSTAINVGQATGAVGTVTVQAGIVRATGSGVSATGVGANAVSVTTTDVQSATTAVFAGGGAGAATINSGIARSTATGPTATTLTAISTGAAATVVAADTQSAGGRGIFARGQNDVSVTSGTLVAAAGSTAIIANTATAAQGGNAAGSVTVNSGTLTSGGTGINAYGPRATVNVGSIMLTAGNTFGNALEAYGLDVLVNSGTIATTGSGINAGNANEAVRGANVTVNSGSVTMNGTDAGTSSGIFANGQTVTINSGTITATGTGNRVGINTLIGTPTGGGNDGTMNGALTVNSGSITTVGNGAYGIRALADAGLLTINSTGTITTVGGIRQVAANAFRYSDGITATSFNGSATITSNNIVTTGDQAVGIRVEAGSGVTQNPAAAAPIAGTVTVASNGAISTAGAMSDGIQVQAGAGTVNVTNAGAITTTGATSAGVTVAASGAITIANTGTIATTGNGSAAVAAQAGAGATVVTSNAVSTTGTSATGITVDSTTGAISINATSVGTAGAESAGVRAQSTGGAITVQTGTVNTAFASPGISARSTDGAVSITAGTTTMTAPVPAGGGIALVGANAIDGRSTNGAVTISAATTNASSGTAVNAQAGTAAAVTVTGSANATGDDSAGVRATGGTGVTLNVANATSTGASVGGRADAIFAEALTGTINATVGSASAQGVNADAVHLVANGAGGAVSLSVTGNVTSAGGYGVFIDPPGDVTVNVASGATLSGATGGLNTASDAGVNTIVNAGTIRGTAGAGIIAFGRTALDSRGTIAGSGGIAVQLGAANDAVTLRTGSVVTGAIAGGGGTDSATLIGTGTAPTATQTVAAFQGFDSLTLQGGYWTAPAANSSTVARTIITAGSTLEVQNGAAGIAGYQTGTYTDNGALVVRSSAASAGSTFGAATVTGTGTVLFTGAGTATLGGTNSLTNTGTNTVDAGSTVLITGTQGGTFVNNGTFQIGTGGTTGNFTGNLADNGTLIVNRSDTYNFTGALTGAGLFIKQGAGQVVFGAGYAFTGTTQLDSGSVRLTMPVAANTELDIRGTGTVDLSGQTNTIAELMGSAGGTLNIAGGALTVNQSTSTTFAGMIVGAGAFTKSGAGTLNLTGANTYSGPTLINGGTLAVNGSIASPVTVAAGGTLGGTGTVNGTVAVGPGGIIAPGNSIGTINVASITFAASSIYAVEANAAGGSDRIVASGAATINGGTVAVNATAGNYGQLTNYTILTAGGGVTGRFGNVTSNMAFLSPLLSYTPNAVNLTLARNDIAFSSMATSGNQRAVATAIAGRTFGDAVFNAILFQPNATAAASFDQLSGEVHATAPATLVDSGRRVRDLVLNRAAVADAGWGVWLDGVQTYVRSRDQAGFAKARTNRSGLYGGLDYGSDTFRIGINGGYVDQQLRLPARASRASIDTKLIGGSIAFRPAASKLLALGGLTYGWHDVDTVRAISVVGLPATLSGSGKARSTEAFAEVGYTVGDGSINVTPFVRFSHDWTVARGFTETGGTTALTLGRDKRSVSFGTIGTRFWGSTPFGTGVQLQPKGTLSYEHGWGDLRDGRSASFAAGTGPAFTVTGLKLGRDTFGADLGADAVFDSGLRIGVSGFGAVSRQAKDYGAKVTLGFNF